ncbi:hypothetical protein Gogos_011433 [Gossypium gossypioides]|uniref:Protein kinase domain-containing protein n=1 Tax=Gossypium gossypioides TaxID=34282 RepID=A0A7J9BP99_GOSGO|nr:hypothetical protein [Gossypium gossypioides]
MDFMIEYVATKWYQAPELHLNCSEYIAAIDIYLTCCILTEIIRLGVSPVVVDLVEKLLVFDLSKATIGTVLVSNF